MYTVLSTLKCNFGKCIVQARAIENAVSIIRHPLHNGVVLTMEKSTASSFDVRWLPTLNS